MEGPLNGGDEFFQKLREYRSMLLGWLVNDRIEDILFLLEDEITEDLKSTPFILNGLRIWRMFVMFFVTY